jgi:hypothetical protein
VQNVSLSLKNDRQGGGGLITCCLKYEIFTTMLLCCWDVRTGLSCVTPLSNSIVYVCDMNIALSFKVITWNVKATVRYFLNLNVSTVNKRKSAEWLKRMPSLSSFSYRRKKESRFWEASIYSASPKILRILCSLKAHSCFHKSQMNPGYSLKPYFLESVWILSFHIYLGFPMTTPVRCSLYLVCYVYYL